MPVKKRADKRRMSYQQYWDIWSIVLASGRDFFGELPGIGVKVDEYGRPDREAAADAWAALGEEVIRKNAIAGRTWGEIEFGRPWEASHAR